MPPDDDAPSLGGARAPQPVRRARELAEELVEAGLLLGWKVEVDKGPYVVPLPRDLFNAPDAIDHGLRDVTIRLCGVPLAAEADLERALAAFFAALADARV